jgi:TolB-like protein/DNA-binding winged helix-turn-helix (wHTH) protein
MMIVKASSSVPPTLRFGVFELDPKAGELRKKGMKIRLQGQPVEILVMLLERPGETVTREELQKKLWPADTFVDFEQGLNNAMQRLRAALDDDAESPHFIETVPRRGYRFIGAVHGGPRNGAEPTALTEAQLDAGKKPARYSRIGTRLAAVGLLGLTVAVALLLGLNVRGWRDRVFMRSPKPQIQALAVLPLTNLSGDPEQEYFADGMTEALITELGKVSKPRVISRQSIMQYKGSKKALQEIAKELRVDAVLEGAVERSGDRVRVTVRLDQVSPEGQLWSNQYNRDIRDLMRLQDEIARAVTDEVQVKLTPQERARLASSRTVDPEVQDNFLRGLYFAGPFSGGMEKQEQNFQMAISYFKKAIERDQAFAPAYAELAMVYFWLGNPQSGGPSARETMPQAKAAVTKALQLDPSLARAHLALGLVTLASEWDWRSAENEYRLALSLNPNCGECYQQYSVLLTGLGRSDEATVQINRAMELDPANPVPRCWAAWIAFLSRKYDLAITESGSLPEPDCKFITTGLSYAQKRMYPEAIASLQEGVARSGRQPIELGVLAQTYGAIGRKREAQKIISELKERSRHHYVFPSVFANAYLGLGEKDQALTYLERAYEEQDPWLFYLKVWPPLDPLRSEPRFQALLRRVNLPQ